MDATELQSRLENTAEMLAIEDWVVTEYEDAVQLSWEDGTLERNVSLGKLGSEITVECNVWEDDYDALERRWYNQRVGAIVPEYPTVLSEAIQCAFEEALNTSASQLTKVDGLKKVDQE